MLKMYLVSSLICMIVVRILCCVAKNTAELRGIDFRKYRDNRIKEGNWIYLICFVPILRIILIGLCIFLSFAKKEDLENFIDEISQ